MDAQPAESPAPGAPQSRAAAGGPEPDPAGSPPETPRGAALPSVSRQKSFIIENARILNKKTQIAILAIVMMEIGPTVVSETGSAREVDINLDEVANQNREVLLHIYNIVRARLDALNQPA